METIKKPAQGPRNGSVLNGSAVDDDLAGLARDMRIIHELRISGSCEWKIMAAVTRSLSLTSGRLCGLAVTRFGPGDVSLNLKVSDLMPGEARAVTSEVLQEDGITHSQVEHMALRAR